MSEKCIYLWCATYDRHVAAKKPIKTSTGRTTCGTVETTEIRFLASDFKEAAEIAQKQIINDDELTLVHRISHITGGVGIYNTVKIKEQTK